MNKTPAILFAALTGFVADTAHATQCQWNHGIGQPGLNGNVSAFVDYQGLVASGSFTKSGQQTVNRIARWTGSAWVPLGGQDTGFNSVVNAMTTYQTHLYVGGRFTSASGIAAQSVARWDGSGWSAVGDGFQCISCLGTDPEVNALVVYNEPGGGPALYAAGRFNRSGTQPLENIARWNGTAWTPVGQSDLTGGIVHAMIEFNGLLYVGGNFTSAGGQTALGIATWNAATSTWAPLVVGGGATGTVRAFAEYHDGISTALYIGGSFASIGTVPNTGQIARWDGQSISAVGMGGGTAVDVYALEARAGSLFVGGSFLGVDQGIYNGVAIASSLAEWDGTKWRSLHYGGVSSVVALHSGSTGLIIGGTFTQAGSGANWGAASRVTEFVGCTIPSCGGWDAEIGKPGTNGNIDALADYDGHLYVGGWFPNAGAVNANGLARWDAQGWSTTPGWLANANVRAMHVHNNALYVGGQFSLSPPAANGNGIARWDGTAWDDLGQGVVGSGGGAGVYAMTTYGGDLIAGGLFAKAGGTAGISAANVARWDGTSWHAMGAGLNGHVLALVEYNGQLIAGGNFTTSGPTAMNRIARWDVASSTWQPVFAGDMGFNDTVHSLAVYNGDLYVGGRFSLSTSAGIARWNGGTTGWTGVGGGVDDCTLSFCAPTVEAMAVFDDNLGGGPMLYAVGDFNEAGTEIVYRTARWDGQQWSPVGFGTHSGLGLAVVRALAEYDDGSGPALYFGGQFLSAGGMSARDIAAWRSCGGAPTCGPSSPNNCCAPSTTPSCNDAACCASVCNVDSFCCDPAGSWDGACAALAQSMCPICAPQTTNDTCANAAAVGYVMQMPFDNFGAVTDGPPEPAPCGFTGVDDSDVWFEFIAPVDGQHRVTAHAHPAGPSPARHLAVYDGLCPVAGGPNLGCESAVVAPVSVCFDAFAGNSYIVRVGTPGGAAGQSMFLLDVEHVPCIGVQQLLALLGCWGPVAPGSPCAAWNFTGSGNINVLDLLHLLANWGCPPCP